MKITIKHIVFSLILVVLILPALQSIFHFFPERPLNGEFEEKGVPELNTSSWFSGTFQSAFDPWLEENIGFHNVLVRLNNQVDYSIFHSPNAEGVVRGRQGQLYEHNYIRAWTGIDFVGEELIDLKFRQFRFIQKHLKEIFDIDLVLVLEPGKASVYPEDIPSKYKKAAAGKSNYDYMRKRAEELGINLIDMNAWFIDIKNTVDYPLFPKQGTHWSEFAMWYAADSLISYIEAIREIDLPEVVIDSMDYSMELRSSDYDVGVTLNLLFELEHGEMPYPQYHFREDSTHTKPNVLAIADSYYWNIFNTRIPENLFSQPAFWYFYKKIYPDSYFGEKYVQDINLKTEIEKQDVIFFMATERFLYKIDRGFIDDMIKLYGISSSMNRITRHKTSILNLGSWFTDVIRKARKKNISTGEMLERDARYMLLKEDPEAYYSLFGTEVIISSIRHNHSWLQNIRHSAQEKGISLEEALMSEATYILKTEHPQAFEKYNRVKQLMSNIRSDSSWYAYVTAKAGRYYMTEEEMVRAEAEYVFLQEGDTEY